MGRKGGKQGRDIVNPAADGDPAIGGGAMRRHFRRGVPPAAMPHHHLSSSEFPRAAFQRLGSYSFGRGFWHCPTY